MVAAGQSKGRQTVMMGDVCEMQDGSLRSTKIRDACMFAYIMATRLVPWVTHRSCSGKGEGNMAAGLKHRQEN